MLGARPLSTDEQALLREELQRRDKHALREWAIDGLQPGRKGLYAFTDDHTIVVVVIRPGSVAVAIDGVDVALRQLG